MNRPLKNAIVAAALAVTFIFSAPAFAKNDGHKGKGKHERYDDRGHHEYDHNEDGIDINISIGGSDREVIRHYIAEDYRGKCPPGLAKKRNGCLPPGQAKKRYSIGRPLPSGVIYQPIPGYVLDDLGPVPYGYRYVRVDQDVLLISEASKKVIDAITLLSAVGN